jgi:muconolactone delta-isomerase
MNPLHALFLAAESGNRWTSAAVIDQTITHKGDPMKYMISWFERPQGSAMEYENAQKRILEVFGQWKAPANFKIEVFVIRVGEWGGHMLVDCDDPLTVHQFCSTFPAFEFQARPVVPVADIVRAELEVIAWRDGLKGK